MHEILPCTGGYESMPGAMTAPIGTIRPCRPSAREAVGKTRRKSPEHGGGKNRSHFPEMGQMPKGMRPPLVRGIEEIDVWGSKVQREGASSFYATRGSFDRVSMHN